MHASKVARRATSRLKARLAVISAVALVGGMVAALPAFAAHTDVKSGDGLVESVRWAGANRFGTASKLAVEGSAAATSTPAEFALLARADLFPDALAGSYLSGQQPGPILLTETDKLTQETKDRLSSTEASGLKNTVNKVYILGGTNAVSAAVEAEVEAIGFEVERVSGVTRIETAAEIATFEGATVGTVDGERVAIVARADNFPDALVAGAPSRGGQLPLLLTETNSLPQATSDALAELDIDRVLIAGGNSAVNASVETELQSDGYATTRIQGGERTATAVEFARYNVDKLDFVTDEVGLSRGDLFPDALAFGPFAGREQFSILLSGNPDLLGDTTEGYMEELASCTFDTLYIPGGQAAISDATEMTAREALTTDENCAGVDNQDPSIASAELTTDGTAAVDASPATDDVVTVTYDENVNCSGDAPQQFSYTDSDGNVTAATSITCAAGASADILVNFPGDTVTDGSGTINYLEAGKRDARVTDGDGNEATSPDEFDLGDGTGGNALTPSAYVNPDTGKATQNDDVEPTSSCEAPDQQDTQQISADTAAGDNNVHVDACLFETDDMTVATGVRVDTQATFEVSGVGEIFACPDPDGAGDKTATKSADSTTCTLSGYEDANEEYHVRVLSDTTGEQTVTFCDDPEGDGCDNADATSEVTVNYVDDSANTAASASAYINPDTGAASENLDVDAGSSCETPDQTDTQEVSNDTAAGQNNVHVDACLFDTDDQTDATGVRVDTQASFQISGVVGEIFACPDPDGAGSATATLSADGTVCTLSSFEAANSEYHVRVVSDTEGQQTVTFCEDPQGDGCTDTSITSTVIITYTPAVA